MRTAYTYGTVRVARHRSCSGRGDNTVFECRKYWTTRRGDLNAPSRTPFRRTCRRAHWLRGPRYARWSSIGIRRSSCATTVLLLSGLRQDGHTSSLSIRSLVVPRGPPKTMADNAARNLPTYTCVYVITTNMYTYNNNTDGSIMLW